MATRIQFPRLISRGPIEATQLGRAEANGNMRSKESGRGRSRFRNEADHGSGAKTISDTRLNAISNRPVLNEKSSGSSINAKLSSSPKAVASISIARIWIAGLKPTKSDFAVCADFRRCRMEPRRGCCHDLPTPVVRDPATRFARVHSC